MPNYCYNTLTVSGDRVAVEEATKYIINDKGEVDFEIVVPMPEQMYINDVPYDDTFKPLVEVPDEFYKKVKLVELRRLLKSLEFLAAKQKPPEWLSFTRVGISKRMIDGIYDLEKDTTWLQMDKNLVQNINDGVEFVNKYKAIIDRSHRSVLRNLFDIYYYIYSGPYCLEEYDYADWYSWSIANWGTKWNAIHVTTQTDEAVFVFDTAWGPADEWFERLDDLLKEKGIYVTIQLQYAEPGCMFGGEILKTADGEYASVVYTDEQILEFIGSDEEEDDDDHTLKDLLGVEPTTVELPTHTETNSSKDDNDDDTTEEHRPAA